MWIKQVGCDCPECGVDACTEGCVCDFYDGNNIFAYDHTYDWTTFNAIDHDIAIDVENYGACDTGYSACGYDLTHYFQIEIYADATLIYDSGCVSANLTSSVTVPADTVDLRIVVSDPCGGHCGCESGGLGDWYVYCL
jgi:hypothetical protein